MKKKIRLAAPFIVTLSSAACTKEPERLHPNPPGPDPTPSATTAVTAPTVTAPTASARSIPTYAINPPPVRFLNAEIEGDTVTKSKGKCSAAGKVVACPAAMMGPAWDKCDGGRIRQLNGACVCQSDGPAPLAMKTIDCP